MDPTGEISRSTDTPTFLLDPSNRSYIGGSSVEQLPGLFRTNRLLAYFLFLVIAVPLVAVAVQRWRTTIMLSAPSGLRRDGEVLRLSVESSEEVTTYRVEYRFEPFGDERWVSGTDAVDKSYYRTLERGGRIPICFASDETSLSKALPHCDDPPILLSALALATVAFFLFLFLKDACLRRGRLLRGEILQVKRWQRQEASDLRADPSHHDMFLVSITYCFESPSGRRVAGRASHSRVYLGNEDAELPLPGTPLLVQYAWGLHRPL